MPELSPVASAEPRTEVMRGKSAESVGQRAKSASAEMRAAGGDLPPNTQGVLASAIARGVPSENMFAARVSGQPVAQSKASAGSTTTESLPNPDPAAIPEAKPVPDDLVLVAVSEGASLDPGQPGGTR